MKKLIIMLTNFLFLAFLAACGGKAEQEEPWIGIAPDSDLAAVTERTEYYDLAVETEELFELGLWEKNPEEYYSTHIERLGITVYNLLGMQFAEGKPAQIWSEVSPDGVNIYLYRTDGSRELLASGLSDNDCAFVDARYDAFVDQDKNCYCYRNTFPKIDGEYMYVNTIMKILPTGEISYQNTLETGFRLDDIRQTEDGRIYLLMANYDTRKEVLEELDPDTGQLIPESRMEWDFISDGSSNLGTAGAFPARASIQGLDSIDTETKSTSPILYADGTSYGLRSEWDIQDFQVLEDGTIEVLWSYQRGHGYTMDRMRMEKVEKTPLVVRAVFEDDFWLSEKVALFNQKSRDYHVVLESCGYGNDVEDYARLTSVQVGAGKGPDILCGSELLQDYVSGMMEKGALEELNPYMEASGIREEDYFPLAFSAWRQGEKIYSVTPKMDIYYEEMDAEVLGSAEPPEIETLADALLAREESAVYRQGLTSEGLLDTFLQGSESLWGMVDWKSGSCDFNTPLFEKLLEAARRYGYDDRRTLEQEITRRIKMEVYFHFSSPAEQREEGTVYVGTLFDDGCHVVSYPWYTMAVNANSPNKEWAWEFIEFLLGEEMQYREEYHMPPVHRESFDKWLEWQLMWLTEPRFEDNGKGCIPVYYGENTSAEKVNAYKKALEDARSLPIQTVPILKIIQEEAEDYFNGSKNAEEVSRVINNRVQLYLDERK